MKQIGELSRKRIYPTVKICVALVVKLEQPLACGSIRLISENSFVALATWCLWMQVSLKGFENEQVAIHSKVGPWNIVCVAQKKRFDLYVTSSVVSLAEG